MRLTRSQLMLVSRARAALCDDDPAPSLSSLARTLGATSFQLIRLFHAAYGQTPHQLQIAHRLAVARRLLADSSRSVTSICMEVGFSSVGSFGRLFKQRTGMSPNEYRARALVRKRQTTLPTQPGCLTLLAHLPPDAQFRRSAQR